MWAQAICFLLGVWLTMAPDILGYGGKSGIHDHILGPLVASFGFIALWELLRPVRWVNVFLGIWLIFSGVFIHSQEQAVWNAVLVGVVLANASLIKGVHRPERFGGGWSSLWAGPKA